MTTYRPGFKGFRKAETIASERLSAAIEKVDPNAFVFWTGNTYGRRRQSLRSQSLATINEKRKPIPVAELVSRAARANGEDIGFDPDTVRSGLALHQGAKPAVYLYLEAKRDANDKLLGYYAVKSIPRPDGQLFAHPIQAGDQVLDPKGNVIPALRPKG